MKNGGNSCGDISMKCKQGFKMFRNHCYKFVTTKMNFFNAEMFCRTQQSSLVDIGDAEEDKWIKKISNELSSDVWISATDLAQAGEWKWLSTGLPPLQNLNGMTFRVLIGLYLFVNIQSEIFLTIKSNLVKLFLVQCMGIGNKVNIV